MDREREIEGEMMGYYGWDEPEPDPPPNFCERCESVECECCPECHAGPLSACEIWCGQMEPGFEPDEES